MNKIKVFWWKLNKGHGNFGDELNPYIINKLSNIDVEHVQINYLRNNFSQTLISVARKIKNKKYQLKKISKYREWKYLFKHPYVILGIGSVISLYKYKKTIVWGSGIIKSDANIYPAIFKAVRGKYTQKRMIELGLNPPNTIGDPALLLPIIFNPKIKKTYQLALIPHYKHFRKMEKANKNNNLIVINLLDDIETIITQIKSSELTISTSLHGLIVSHAYNVPSLWVKFKEGISSIGGDDVKFKDYFSSVDLPEYKVWDGLSLADRELDELLNELKKEPKENFLPNHTVIKKLQNDLIKVAPFPVIPRYRDLI